LSPNVARRGCHVAATGAPRIRRSRLVSTTPPHVVVPPQPGTATKNAKEATYTPTIGLLDGIRRLLAGAKADAEAVAEGEVPAATRQGGGDERETSTNAQMAGASDEPWSGND
jgi:hypothetical protein